jgi:hypothetical protein
VTRGQLAKHLADPHVSAYARALDPEVPLDRWISFTVKVLRDAGIETYESCQGGPGHSYAVAAVRFGGIYADGFKALAVAKSYGLPVGELCRLWSIDRDTGEPIGPNWELTFSPLASLKRRQLDAEQAGLLGAPKQQGPGRTPLPLP